MTSLLSELYREIPLTQGQTAIVDCADFESLSRFRWYAHWCSYTQSFYARCGIPHNGRTKQILMHRMILGLTDPTVGVDHENRNTVDNRRGNLRLANHSENGGNTKKRSDNKSGYKGVCWHKAAGRWIAQIQKDNKTFYLGLHDTPELAYAAYCEAAKDVHKQFARIA